MEVNNYTYCGRLKELRKERGWSLQDAADMLKVSKSAIKAYETTPEKNCTTARKPSIEFLLKACDVYGVTLDYLCGRSDVQVSSIEQAAIIEKYGLSNEVLGFLERFKATDVAENKAIIEFLNAFIECPQIYDLSQVVVAYILDIQVSELWRKKYFPDIVDNSQKSDLNYERYEIIRCFDRILESILKSPAFKERAEKVYNNGKFSYLDYLDGKSERKQGKILRKYGNLVLPESPISFILSQFFEGRI